MISLSTSTEYSSRNSFAVADFAGELLLEGGDGVRRGHGKGSDGITELNGINGRGSKRLLRVGRIRRLSFVSEVEVLPGNVGIELENELAKVREEALSTVNVPEEAIKACGWSTTLTTSPSSCATKS